MVCEEGVGGSRRRLQGREIECGGPGVRCQGPGGRGGVPGTRCQVPGCVEYCLGEVLAPNSFHHCGLDGWIVSLFYLNKTDFIWEYGSQTAVINGQNY